MPTAFKIRLLCLLCGVLLGRAEEAAPGVLAVFVAEKVSLESRPPDEGEDGYGFRAVYRNLETVYGDLPLGEVTFTGTDEFYDPPRFARHDHVLMYVYLKDGGYHHVKHLFSPLYRTPDGRWAAPYDWVGYTHKANVDTPIKAVDIVFPESATRILTPEQVEHLKYYPEIYVPFTMLDGNKMVPVQGNYLPELFELNKHGPLTDFGFFKAD